MASLLYVKGGGTIHNTEEVYVNENGTWKRAGQIFINESGTWKPLFSNSGSESFTTVGSHSFQVPSGIYTLNVAIQGGGGGGGGGNEGGSGGGGGGGGAGGNITGNISVRPYQDLNIVVGGAGAGAPTAVRGTLPVPQGTGGGNSQVITPDASYVASGGARGESAITGLAPGMFGAGGAGGSTSGPSGPTYTTGNTGSNGSDNGGDRASQTGGAGASSPNSLGTGGAAGTQGGGDVNTGDSAGKDASGVGAGGGGAGAKDRDPIVYSTPYWSGGEGTAGKVTLSWS